MIQYCPFDRFLTPLKGYAPLVLRLVLGVIFIAHGGQKLFGWFGGDGFDATAKAFEGLLPIPGTVSAVLGGGGEFFGGLMALVGLRTRFAGFLIANTMVVAIATVHWQGGLFAANNGFEYPLLCLAASVALMLTGSGALGIDNLLTAGGSCCPHNHEQACNA